jgi:hypothetical protein
MTTQGNSRVSVLVLFPLLMLTACRDDVHRTWSEEARLSDGRTIVVHRTIEGKKGQEPGFPGAWLPTSTSIDIPAAAAAGGVPPPPWRGSLVPVLLDYEQAQDTWRLIATVPTCEEWTKLGRPEPPYLEYQSTGGQSWRQVPLEPQRIGQKTNLLPSPGTDETGRLIPLHEKEYQFLGLFNNYQQIVTRWNTSC